MNEDDKPPESYMPMVDARDVRLVGYTPTRKPEPHPRPTKDELDIDDKYNF